MRYLLLFLAVPVCAAEYSAPAGIRPALRRPGAASILPGGRIISPLGHQYVTGPGPFGLAISASGKTLASANSGSDRFSLTVLEREKGGASLFGCAVVHFAALLGREQFLRGRHSHHGHLILLKVLLENFRRCHVEALEGLQFRLQDWIFGDLVGMQLLLDPLLHADFADLVDIAGTGAESQAIQRLNDLSIRSKFGVETAGGGIVRSASRQKKCHSQSRNRAPGHEIAPP